MRIWKNCVLLVLAAVLAMAAFLTRGSLGSAVCIYCLIIMGAALLTQRFVLHRDNDEFDME